MLALFEEIMRSTLNQVAYMPLSSVHKRSIILLFILALLVESPVDLCNILLDICQGKETIAGVDTYKAIHVGFDVVRKVHPHDKARATTSDTGTCSSSST